MAAAYPINATLPEIQASLEAHPRLVLEAPPGAGKTTQVPLALLQAPWCTGKILMLEPRRIAARAAANFMASQLGEAVGATIGYRIRFEHKVSSATRIEIVTEGILTRLLQEDPTLHGVDAVIFDEFHERHLASDLGLALCLDVQTSLRPALRLLVMSATLDGERLARFLDAPRITALGRSFPVTVRHLALKASETPELQLKRAIRTALEEANGDILCFLPGKAELERAARSLTDIDATVLTLHGEMSIEDQTRALAHSDTRRVVLATNVAESSVTLSGVRAVVDSGLAREPRFDPTSGMSRLETVFIAQSSATQRAGRAGRIAEGWCYRLWPESQRLDSSTRPEIQQVDLATFVLELKAWGSDNLRFLDPPPPGALAQAHAVLQALDALDSNNRITAHGQRLLALGLHPRLANALQRAPRALQGLACDLAAFLESRDALRGAAQRNDDLRVRISALNAFRRGQLGNDVARGALAQIEQTARHYRRRMNLSGDDGTLDAHAVGDVLAFAYPDRIAKRDATNPRRYQLSNGRGARLREDSALLGEPWLVVAEVRFDERDSLIQKAAACDPTLLERDFASHFTQRREHRFNRTTLSVETHDIEKFAELVLSQRQTATPRTAAAAEILLEAIATLGLHTLPWSEAAREWQTRVECLRTWCPQLGLPSVGDTALHATLATWLEPMLAGKIRIAEIAAAEFAAALHSHLDYAQRKLVDEHAPTDLLVPSGMRRALRYVNGEAPVLAVKLQELFGLADTPCIAQGRVPVVLHLLSPRQVPIQVTQDLRGFWDRTYPEVRKELKGRYPKHPWPVDPWTAAATHRAKPRV